MTDYKLPPGEWLKICNALEDFHSVFYKVWTIGKPLFSDAVPTAAIQFDREGDFIVFHFNPEFWEKLDFYNKLVVICHEALHVILNHGVRIKDAYDRMACNVALDVVVNSALVRDFGFDRSKIYKQEDLCWVDTVFKNRKQLPKDNESFEHYFNLFEKVYGHGKPLSACKTMDDHKMLGESADDNGKIIDKLNEGLCDEEKEMLKDFIEKHFEQEKDKPKTSKQAGTVTGGQWVFANIQKKKKKKKWETVIKRWSKKYMTVTDKDTEQWARINRRLTSLSSNFFIPSDMEIEDYVNDKKRIKVHFFLDTSGSCWDLKDRFFTAAATLPPERFEVRLFCFDTQVQETSLESKKVYGGGGTAFDILENYIQKECNAGKEYPIASFVITDGYGNTIKPQFPDRWYWFLSPGGSKSCIDKNCNFFKLEDYE